MMTLIINTGMDEINTAKDSKKRNQPMKVGDALHHVIKQAALLGRLRRGILECSRVLHRYPDHVMLCLLKTSVTPDNHLQHTLIQAFCREHGLKLVMVDSCKPLACNGAIQHPKEESTTDCNSDRKLCTITSAAIKDEKSKTRISLADTLQTHCAQTTVKHTQIGLFSQDDGNHTENSNSKTARRDAPHEKGCCSGAHEQDADDSCLLILKPDVLSKEDEFVLAYHDIAMYCSFVQFPSIRLPYRD